MGNMRSPIYLHCLCLCLRTPLRPSPLIFAMYRPKRVTRPVRRVCSPTLKRRGGASVVLAGQGSTTPIWKDTYQQAPENQVDILFVVDNSGSMTDEQLSLVQGFQSFIDQAALWNVKYQIGVVTTDVKHDGQHEPRSF